MVRAHLKSLQLVKNLQRTSWEQNTERAETELETTAEKLPVCFYLKGPSLYTLTVHAVFIAQLRDLMFSSPQSIG